MRVPNSAFVIILLTFCNPTPTVSLVDDVVDIPQIIKDIENSIFENRDLVKAGQITRRDTKLLNKFVEISKDIKDLELVIMSTATSLSTLLKIAPSKSYELKERLHKLADLVNLISTAGDKMKVYAEGADVVEQHTLDNFANWCVSHGSEALASLLERIHSMLTPSKLNFGLLSTGLLDLIVQTLNESEDRLCTLQQSPHQLIYNMYNSITLTEIKGYAMMQFSWMLLRIHGKGNFKLEAGMMKQKFQERSAIRMDAVKSALANLSREMWICDPSEHKEGKTFVQLTRLLQGYVENEVDMNIDGYCTKDCEFYNKTVHRGCYYNEFCSRQQMCSGEIRDCYYIDSHMYIWTSYESTGRGRRYERIEYDNKEILGKSTEKSKGSVRVKSWTSWFWYCSYCMCLCDQDDKMSHRTFSLRPVTSDVKRNKVVTGVRFTKVKTVIHLQISEGTLLSRGKIDPFSVRWKDVEPLDITDSKLKKGVDYHTMSYEERSLDLDDLHGDDGHLLTGLRFRKVGSHLNLEIQITPFDFTTGKLIDLEQKSLWIANNQRWRHEVLLYRPDISNHSRTPSIKDSKSNQYIQFTHTNFEADVAQTTVPFLDAQPVTPIHPVPLTGAGIYHKGNEHYGGFVAPKVFTYDFGKHMNNTF